MTAPAAWESTSAPVEPGTPRTEFYPGTGQTSGQTEKTPIVAPDEGRTEEGPRKTVPIGSNALSRLQSDRR